jgi:hypothetical protein
MGQFESKPETPDEWAGLPSEPLNRHDSTDLEADVAAIDALTLDLGAHLGSVVIPVTPTIEEGAPDSSAEPGPDE